jgi:hypothetical protein
MGGKGEERNDGQEGMMDRSDGQKRIDGHQPFHFIFVCSDKNTMILCNCIESCALFFFYPIKNCIDSHKSIFILRFLSNLMVHSPSGYRPLHICFPVNLPDPSTTPHHHRLL